MELPQYVALSKKELQLVDFSIPQEAQPATLKGLEMMLLDVHMQKKILSRSYHYSFPTSFNPVYSQEIFSLFNYSQVMNSCKRAEMCKEHD